MIKIDLNLCNLLFPNNFLELSVEKRRELDEISKTVLLENDWNEVYTVFNLFLRNNCKTEDSVINFVYLFIRYVGFSFEIPSQYDPYDLVGFVYSKVDLEKRWDDCGDFFDAFANEALKIDLVKDPYYQFWRDPKILEIAKKYGKN